MIYRNHRLLPNASFEGIAQASFWRDALLTGRNTLGAC